MKDQYQKEMSHIHVPPELLEKTKKAMKEEEEKKKKKGKLLPFRIISFAAAAICLFMLMPAVFRGQGEISNKPEIRLSLQEQDQPNKIERKEDGILEVKEVSKKPKDFNNAKEIPVSDMVLFIIKDTETGYIKAYFEKERIGYEILSKVTEEEEFIKAVLDYLE